MTANKEHRDPLAKTFNTQQARALAESFDTLRAQLATKQEVAELRGMLQEVLGRIDAALRPQSPAPAPEPAPAADSRGATAASPQAAVAEAEGVSEEAVVIIAATVAALWGKKARVRRIQRHIPTSGPSSAWAHQGRVVVHGSHNLGRFRQSR